MNRLMQIGCGSASTSCARANRRITGACARTVRELFSRSHFEPLEARTLLSGLDLYPPHILDASPLPADGGTSSGGFSQINITLSETLSQPAATSPANWELREAGTDGLLGTGDDTLLPMTVSYAGTAATLTVSAALGTGVYRFTAKSALADLSGNALAGGDFVRNFNVVASRFDARTYTSDADFTEGVFNGTQATGGQVELERGGTLPYIWMPNQANTVSKVDVLTGNELARYMTAPAGVNTQPSRTTVDLYGNCYVGNRYSGSVVKIGLLESGQWIDRNGNGVADTSRDVNGDGNITGGEMLAFGQDECLLYEVIVIPGREGTFVPGTYAGGYTNDWGTPGPRSLAIDQGNNLWVGCYGSQRFYKIRGDNGAILSNTSVSAYGHNAYGATIDANGMLWSTTLDGRHVLRIDTKSEPPAITRIDLNQQTYGLGLDYAGHLFVNGWQSSRLSKINIADGSVAWTKDKGELYEGRGVAVTADNNVWAVSTYYGNVYRYDNDGNLLATIAVGGGPTGVAVDSEGKVWVCCVNNEYIHRINPATNTVELSKAITGSGGHYTYSDMTGIVARTITTNTGTWASTCDSGAAGTPWGRLSWNSLEPTGTSITFRVRSSEDQAAWSEWETVTKDATFTVTPAGRYLQIEATLQVTSGVVSPVLHDVKVEKANLPALPENPTPTIGAAGALVNGTLTWNVSSATEAYDVYLWEDGQGKPATPTWAGLTASYKTPQSFNPNLAYQWQVVAKNWAGETAGPVWSFTTEAMPDLQVMAVTPALRHTHAGEQVNVQWTVKNVGAGSAGGSWIDRVYLHSGATFDPQTATLLAEVERAGELAASATYNGSATVTIAAGTAAGQHRFTVVTDAAQQARESAEDNNTATKEFGVTEAGKSVLMVNIHGNNYDGDGYSIHQTLLNAGAQADWVNLGDGSYPAGSAVSYLNTGVYDQVWVFDLAEGSNSFPADYQAIADWYAAQPDSEIIADGRMISSYWHGHLGEGQNLTENYFENLRTRGGGLMLGTDHDAYIAGINTINSLIGLQPFTGNFSLTYIPVDTNSPLMTTPNNMGGQLYDDSSPGQVPYGLQPNGRIMYSVAWHSGNYYTPGISSTIEGVIGFHVDIASPADGSQSYDGQTVILTATPTAGTPPYTYTWSSSPDGALGTGQTLNVSTLRPGQHTITLLGTDLNSSADDASVTLTVLPVANLAASGVTAPTLASPAQSITVGFRVNNAGSAAATGTWQDAVYLSTDNAFGGDTFLGFIPRKNELAAGAGYDQSGSVTIPANVPNGDYWLIVRANDSADLFEVNRDNNLATKAISIRKPVQVTGVTPAAYTQGPVSKIIMDLSGAVVGTDARLASTYELRGLGADKTSGTADDVVYVVTPAYADGSTRVEVVNTSLQAVDLRNWTEKDYSNGAAGTWNVAANGTSVTQSINGSTTFFASDIDFIDRQFMGKIRVANDGDDDHIGLVFGLTSGTNGRPDSYYLLSWKKGNQNDAWGYAEAGFKLLKVFGTSTFTQDQVDRLVWDGETGANSQVLARNDNNNALGWAYNTDYSFFVEYRADGRIEVAIRDFSTGAVKWQTTVNDPAPLGVGKLGFLNLSQSQVTYSGLSQSDQLPEGVYQFTAKSGNPGLRDASLNLDGDADGIGGGDYVHTFTIDTTAPVLGATTIAANQITVAFSDTGGMDPATITDPANYTLLASGGDGIFGNGNDVVVSTGAKTPLSVTSGGLLGYWPANGTAEDVAQDHNGAPSGDAVFASGLFGQGLFLGDSGYAEVADSSDWDFGSENFTISLWAQWSRVESGAVGGPEDVFIGQDAGTGYQAKWFFARGGGQLNFHTNGPGTTPGFYAQTPFTPVAGAWYHLAVRRSDDVLAILINGEVVSTEAFTAALPQVNAPLLIGMAEGFQFGGGSVDDVAIFARALSDAELASIYGSELPSQISAITYDAGTGVATLNLSPAIDDEVYQLTISGSIADLAGNPLSGGPATRQLTLDRGPASVQIELDAASDTGVSQSDGITNDSTPTWNVTVDRAGLIGVDFDNDGTADQTQFVAEGETYAFTSIELGDGARTAKVTFTPAAGSAVNAAQSVTIDTQAPSLVPSSGGFALAFDGVDDVALAPHTVVNGLDNVTTTFWMRTTRTGTTSIISGARSDAGSNEHLIHFDHHQSISLYAHGPYVTWTIPSVADDRWHHFTVVRDGTNDMARMFLDGVDYGTRSIALSPITVAPGGLVIGQDQDTVGGGFEPLQAFGGQLDELKIWKRVLSAAEVQAEFTTGLTGTPADLAAWWRFNEGNGTQALDSSGNGNTATLGSGPATSLPAWTAATAPLGPSATYTAPLLGRPLAFDEPVQAGTVTTASISIAGPSAVTGLSVTGTGASYALAFDPLATPGVYTITATNIADIAGNIAASTGDSFELLADTVAPSVQSFSPTGLTNQTVSSFTITFGERILAASFGTADVGIAGPAGAIIPAGIVELSPTQFQVNLPSALADGAYAITIGPGITDLAGNPLAAAHEAGFTVDRTAPTVTGVTPTSIVTGLSYLDVTFSEPIAPGSISTADVSLSGPGGAVSIGSFTHQGGNVYRASFAAQSAEGNYTLTVGPNITDPAGNAMAAIYTTQVAATGVIAPDLVPGNLSAAAQVMPNTSTTVTWRLDNTGPLAANAPWTDRLYLSTDATLDASDTPIGTRSQSANLASGASIATASLAVTIPALPDGEYYLILKTDADGQVEEKNEANNIVMRTIRISSPVYWVDWASGGGSSATGLLNIGGELVTVSYSGEIAFIQTNGGTNYWNPSSPYISATVPNAPPTTDIIALSQASAKTITFSRPITNPLFAVVSLNGNGYRFNRDFQILSYGAGYWGNGTLTKVDLGGGIYQLNGSGEPHGVLQFQGTFDSVTWTSLTNEYWNGFTIGVTGIIPPAVSLALQADSDKGVSSSDGLTSVRTPTFDVTVNMAGTITLDCGAAGTTVYLAPAAGTFAVTAPSLQDGTQSVIARFTPTGGLGEVTASRSLTLDTQAPRLLTGLPTEQAPAFQRTVRFSEAVYADPILIAQTTMTGPGSVNVPLLGVNGSTDTYVISFNAITTPGEYRIAGHPSIIDLAGNRMDQDGNGTPGEPADAPVDVFTLLADTVKPSVVSVNPVGITNQSFSSIYITFSERMLAVSFQPADLTVTGPNGVIDPASMVITEQSPTLFRVDLPAQSADGQYSILVAAGITDLAGNELSASFSGVLTIDKTTPRITDMQPTGSTSQTVGSVLVTFSEALLAGSLAVQDITLAGPGGNIAISGVSALSDSVYRITFAAQRANGLYTLRINQNVFDRANNALSQQPADNERTFAIALPDLIAEPGVTPLPATAQLGQGLGVSFIVRNAGASAASGAWVDRIYLSADNAFNAGDLLLGTFNATSGLDAGAWHESLQNVTLPADLALANQTYHILVVTDAGSAVTESNESNAASIGTLLLQLPDLPDLRVADVAGPANASAGGTALVTWNLLNAGPTTATGTWTTAIYLSSDSAVGADRLIKTVSFTGSLAQDQSVPQQTMIDIPPQGVSGDQWIIVKTNAGSEIFESDAANNADVADAAMFVPVTLTLGVPVTSIAENASPNTIRSTITRSGDVSQALTVNLTSSDTDELLVPATVIIPSGQYAAVFNITVVNDGVIDPDAGVLISASAPLATGDSRTISVTNIHKPTLTVSLSEISVTEGDPAAPSIQVTITRDAVNGQPVSVSLSSSQVWQFGLPGMAIIPANEASVTLTAAVLNDATPEKNDNVTITASATGHNTGSASIVVVDDDVPSLTVTLSGTQLSEGAGPQGLFGTVERAAASTSDIVVRFISSNTGKAVVPKDIVIPANRTSANFYIAGVDNSIVDGSFDVTITANVIIPSCGCGVPPVGQSATASFTVLDNDGPTLTLAIDRDIAGEGSSAATLTVSRNTATDAELTVSLASSDSGEATVPPTVTIPAGQFSSSPIPITTLLDGVVDGNQTVTITASADGFASGADSFIVSDTDLPDLVVAQLTAPAAVLTETYFNVTYRTENRGLATAISANANPDLSYPGSWVERVFLSDDPYIGNDTSLGTFTFTGTMPNTPGLNYFERTVPVRAPRAAGSYWLIVQTDANDTVTEGIESNNTRISVTPVSIQSAYTAIVQTDTQTAPAGTPIVFTGQAIAALAGAPAPYALVNLHITVRGTTRIISALADVAGSFTTTWSPLANEGGHYTVGAAHPGETTAPVQDEFDLLGIKVEPPSASVRMVEGAAPVSGSFTIRNLSEIALTGLRLEVLDLPASLTLTTDLDTSTGLAGLATKTLSFQLAAIDASIWGGTFRLRMITNEAPPVDVPVQFTVDALRPVLSANPGSLQAGMLRGRQTIVEFTLSNTGGLASGPVSIGLPPVSWMKLASPAPANIAPGESVTVTLLLSPPADLPLTAYPGSLAINPSTGAGVLVPFEFRAHSDMAGTLTVQAVDEYFYYTAGAPALAGAAISVRDPISGNELRSATSDANGEAVFTSLPEGYYKVRVTAADHSSYDATIFVNASDDNRVLAFLARNAVKYTWTVVPTTVEDRYEITVDTTFETNVPVPVVVIEPGVIDLAELDIVGDQMQVDLKITNHGLISAFDVSLDLGKHPFYDIRPLLTDVDELPAKSSIVVPVIITRVADFDTVPESAAAEGLTPLGNAESAEAGYVPCYLSGYATYRYECGPDGVWRAIEIGYVNGHWGLCWTPSPGGGPTGGGGPIWGGGPGGPVSGWYNPVPINVSSQPCNPCPDDGFEFELCVGGGFLASLAESAAAKIVSLVPYLDADDIDLNVCFSYESERCCENGVTTGWSKKFTGSGQFTIEAFIGPEAEVEIPGVNVSGLGAVNVELEAGIGANITLTGSVSGSAEKTCKGEWVYCVEASLGLEVAVGVTAEAEFKFGGNEATGTVFGGITAGGSLSVSYCSDEGWDYGGCVDDLTLGASAEFEWNDTTFSAGVSTELADGTCDDEAGFLIDEELPPGDMSSFVMSADALAAGLGYGSVEELEQTLFIDLLDRVSEEQIDQVMAAQAALTNSDEGVCATVKLQLSQSVTLTRDAFEATLELENGTPVPLENIDLDIVIRNQQNQDVTSLFGIRPPTLRNLTGVDGAGLLQANTTGTAQWILIPTTDAAKTGPVEYSVGGTLRYRENGIDVVVPLTGVRITVYPQAELDLTYFWQRDVFADDPFTDDVVEPSIPFELAVLVNNKGGGAARNLRIESAQPEIVENEKGLLIDFKIIASEVWNQNLSPSLAVNFGDIPAGATTYARWLMTSTLQGHFIDYNASFKHLDSLGDDRLSLIKSVTIHELIHTVRATGDYEDGKPDFLVNDLNDLLDLPDTLYLSDGSVEDVSLGTDPVTDGPASGGDRTVSLTATMPDGWGYVRLPDPGQGEYYITRVVRHNLDGTTTDLNRANYWQTNRTFIDGANTVRQDVFHLFDRDSTGIYTLHYAPIDETGPAITSVQSFDAPQMSTPDTVDVTFSEAISGFDFTDLSLTLAGGPNLIGGTVAVQAIDPRTWRISGLSALGQTPGQYMLAINAAGVTDLFGNAGSGTRSATWLNTGGLPTVMNITGLTAARLNAALDEIEVTFSEPVNLATFTADDLQLRRDSTPVAWSTGLAFRQTGASTYAISGLSAYTSEEGDYTLSIDVSGVEDLTGVTGVGLRSIEWTMDTTSPQITSAEIVPVAPLAAVDAAIVILTEDIAASSFTRDALSLMRDGTPLAIPAGLTITQTAPRTFRIAGLSSATGIDGAYELSISALNLRDIAGNPGLGIATLSWLRDTAAPAPAQNLAITPDTGVSGLDGVTASTAMAVTGVIAEPGVTVSIYDSTARQDLGIATLAGTAFSRALSFTAPGLHALRIRTQDAFGNFSDALFTIMIDTAAPKVSGITGAPAGDQIDPVTALDVAFSEPVVGFDSSDILLTAGGQTLDASAVTITPLTALSFRIGNLPAPAITARTTFSLRIGAGYADAAGNAGLSSAPATWSMIAPDITPPVVAQVIIQNGESQRSDVNTIQFRFSEPVNAQALIDDGSITSAVMVARLLPGGSFEAIPLSASQFSYDAAASTLRWTTSGGLASPGRYEAHLDGLAFMDDAGNPLAGNDGGVLSFGIPEFASPETVQQGAAAIQTDGYSVPSLADWNADGVPDLIVGEKTAAGGKVRVYLNSGTAAAPDYQPFFHAQSNGADLTVPASGCMGIFPRLTDWDGDGKQDLLAGLADGAMQFFRNVGTTAAPAFDAGVPLLAGPAGVKAAIDVGDRAAFDIADWNNDGRPDLVVGGMDGRIRVFLNAANSGTPDLQAPSFIQAGASDLSVPTGRSSPVVIDIDGDGRKDLVAGNTEGQLFAYLNRGTDAAPVFNTGRQIAVAGVPIDLAGAARSRPFIADIDGDGTADILLGSADGTVRRYLGARPAANHAAPFFVVALNTPATATEGAAASFAALPADGSFTYKWNFGDGVELTGREVQHAFGDNGQHTVTLTITDALTGQTSVDTRTVNVLNANPTANFAVSRAVNEGSSGVASFSAVADAAGDLAAGFTYSFDFNNDGIFDVTSASPNAVVPAQYLADGPSAIRVAGRVSDKDGGFTDYTGWIQVNNLPPTVSSLANVTIGTGQLLAINGSFTDKGADQWTARVDYGDGGGAQALPLAGRSFALTHAYAAPAVYPVTVTVMDDDGGLGTRRFFVRVTGPGIASIMVNDGGAQRSMVTSLTVVFDTDVTADAGAFLVTQRGGASVAATAQQLNGRTFLVTFSGTGVVNGSLADGVYDLQIVAAKVRDAQGAPLAADGQFTFHRLFGDADGDRDVDADDLNTFRSVFNQAATPASSMFDADNDSIIDRDDYNAFRPQLGKKLSY